MPEAILKFNLPEEQPEFQDASNGNKWKLVVWNLEKDLRNKIRKQDHLYTKNEISKFEIIIEKLYELIEEYKLNLEE